MSALHPRSLLLGVLAAFSDQGGLVFESTRVTRSSESDPCRLETADGHAIVARDVVVATHYPIFDRAPHSAGGA
ncbi:hypothetical protein ACFZBU_35775 [Embleya sp. NPDC008237]|uniref:hypothetical protein n=1 Tax=Embleya sp. NPDC008237 TaxID=3363978 RepID=UPI0036EFEA9D